MAISSSFAPGLFASQRQSADLRDLRAQLGDLNRQLATGRRSETLGGLKTGRSTVLTMRADVATIEGYGAVAKRGKVRIGMMTGALDQVTKIARDARSSAMNAAATPEAQRAAIFASRTRLDETIGLLNSDFDGQFLFSGRAATTSPVVSSATLLAGSGGAAGLTTLIDERRQADAGSGLGRLNLSVAGPVVSLGEEAAGLPFGFKLGLAGATGGLSVAGPAGAPAALTVTAGMVQPGEALSLTLTLPDGSSEQIEIVARLAGTVGPVRSFEVGADPASTAANLAGALDTALRDRTNTSLAASSAIIAAEDFFAGSASAPARRIDGPPFATATAFAASGSRPTQQWYVGDDAPAISPRSGQLATVDRGVTLGVGARANEAPLRKVLAGLAVVAAEASGTNTARQQAVLEQSRRLLSQDGAEVVSSISTDLAQAGSAMQAAETRHSTRANLVNGMLADIEQPSMEELSASILSLQTRLQASYQVTANLSRLNLTEYLR